MDRKLLNSRTIIVIVTAIVFFSMFVICDSSYAATKMHLKKTSVTLTIGETYQQKLISSSGKTIKSTNIKWSTAKKSIAKINKSGKVTAVKAGTTNLKAKYKGKTYKFKVVVKKPTFKSSKIILTTGETFTQKMYNANKKLIANKNIQYKCSNKKVATINKAGLITSKKAGTVTITAKYKGKIYKFKVVVKNAYFNEKNIVLTAGDEVSFPKLYNAKGKVISANMIGYDTYNQNIALAWDDHIKAKKAGTTTLTAQYICNKSTCKITVKNGTFKSNHVRLNIGETYLQELYDINGNKIKPSKLTFSCFNDGLVTINSNGLITAEIRGTTEVTVKYNEAVYKFNVTVLEPEEHEPDKPEIQDDAYLEKTNISMYAGDTFQQKLYDTDGTKISESEIVFNIADTNIATINESGIIIAKKSGVTTATAKYDGKVYCSTVSVSSRFSFSSEEIYVHENEPYTVLLTAHKDSPSYEYQINPAGYVSLYSGQWNNGILPITFSFKKAGTITVTFYAYDAPYDKKVITIHTIASGYIDDSKEEEITDGWSVVCSESLPLKNYNYSYSGSLITVVNVDSLNITKHEGKYSNVELEVTGTVTYCKSGWTSNHFIYYKVLDKDGYVIDQNFISTGVYNVGDKFKVTEELTINNPVGKYTIEFYSK